MTNREKVNELKPLPESRGRTTSVYTDLSDGKVITAYNSIADTIATITFTLDENDTKQYIMTLKEGRRKPVEKTIKSDGKSVIIATENDSIVVFAKTGNVYFICSDVLTLYEEK